MFSCSRNPDSLPLDGVSPHFFQKPGMSPVLSFVRPLPVLLAEQEQGFHGFGAGVLQVLTTLEKKNQETSDRTISKQ